MLFRFMFVTTVRKFVFFAEMVDVSVVNVFYGILLLFDGFVVTCSAKNMLTIALVEIVLGKWLNATCRVELLLNHLFIYTG